MIDFTFRAYAAYLKILRYRFSSIMTFDCFFLLPRPGDELCIVRHDVDRNIKNALHMALLEHEFGVRSTYYFRTKPHVFDGKIIKQIHQLGHEIGYHYESWADCKGDMTKAILDFELNLQKLRQWAPVHTVAMHGRPLTGFDNRDMWRSEQHRKLMFATWGIKGDVYLDIDYTDISYICDTGRNWRTTLSNIHDRVAAPLTPDLKNQIELIRYLNNAHPRLILSVHPERWHDSVWGYAHQFLKDKVINLIKLTL